MIPEVARLPGGSLEALALEGTFDRESGFQFRLRAEAPKLRFSDQLEAETLSSSFWASASPRRAALFGSRTLQGRLAGVPVSFSDAALGWRGGVDPELGFSCRSCPCVRRQSWPPRGPGVQRRLIPGCDALPWMGS